MILLKQGKTLGGAGRDEKRALCTLGIHRPTESWSIFVENSPLECRKCDAEGDLANPTPSPLPTMLRQLQSLRILFGDILL